MLRIYVDMDYVLCGFDTAYRRSQSNFPEIVYPHSKPDFFEGKLLHFGSLDYPGWASIKRYFRENYT